MQTPAITPAVIGSAAKVLDISLAFARRMAADAPYGAKLLTAAAALTPRSAPTGAKCEHCGRGRSQVFGAVRQFNIPASRSIIAHPYCAAKAIANDTDPR